SAAVERTRQSIAAGIERERQLAERPARLTRRKFINPPPLEVPGYFQDRFDETRRLSGFLKAPEQRLLTVVGRGGIGKTALVARLLKHLERGELPDGIGTLAVDGIVYLSDVGARPLTFPNLFSDVGKLLPDETVRALDATYRDPKTPTTAKLAALLRHFPHRSDDGSEGRPVIVLLDNFETRLDPADHRLTDSDLDEALHALLTLPPHRLKVIITSRVAPRDLLLAQPHYQQQIYLDEGLASPHAEALLRARDPDGKLGLKSVTDTELAPAITHTRGYPRALEALTAALAADRDTDLAELLAAAETALPDNVVEVLVGEAYSRLAPTAQQVLQALAVYGRPVPLTAIDYLLEPYHPDVDSAPNLKRLVNMNFVNKEGGLYYLHPVDRAHALSHIPQANVPSPQPSPGGRGSEQIPLPLGGVRGGLTDETDNDKSSILPTPYSLLPFLHRAADYFKTTRKPRAEWKSLPDLAPQLAEFDLRCEAGDFDAAALVLTGIDYDYLLLWGHYRLIIDRHQRLQGKIEDPALQQSSAGNLGIAYSSIGQVQQAIDCYEQALAGAREQKNQWNEGALLGNLGLAYADLGETRRAIEYYEQALAISRDIGDRGGEGNHLGSLGSAYAALGETRRAIDYYEQALIIVRDIGDRRGEGSLLGNLGNRYANLGETRRAIEYHEQALAIACDIGNRAGEGVWIGNLGLAYANLGETHRAIGYYEQALAIARDIGDRASEGTTLGNLGSAYSFFGDTEKAIGYYEQALAIARDIGDRGGEGNHLGSLGVAYSNLGETHQALNYYEQGLAIARDIGDRRGEGNHLDCLGNCYTDLGETRRAIDYY
ncbi:MAG: tetratricopeptide repeat protein, partial [Anaerolineae bacterium]|nr:tetratricopeptide repeat protein [Anaerolineae bacterium]